MKYLFIALIRFYQITISKLKPPCCRFYPTCSAYGITAIRRFGVIKGGYLTLKRILRCNPFSKGGYDPVPDTFTFRSAKITKKKSKKKEKNQIKNGSNEKTKGDKS